MAAVAAENFISFAFLEVSVWLKSFRKSERLKAPRTLVVSIAYLAVPQRRFGGFSLLHHRIQLVCLFFVFFIFIPAADE